MGTSEGDTTAGRARDPERSRRRILEAAEVVFAERGYRGASLQAVADAAGVSRATPSYFFGSKEALYLQVLIRVHEAREEALRPAFAPLRAWAAGEPDVGLADAMAAAIDGYFAMLDARPAFARLIGWEALEGGERLRGSASRSTVISDTVRALHDARERRGLRNFDTTDVVVALVSLLFLPVAHRDTFLHGAGLDTSDAAFRARYRDQVVRVMEALLLDETA
jgi:AcrR family transcriptional regulator